MANELKGKFIFLLKEGEERNVEMSRNRSMLFSVSSRLREERQEDGRPKVGKTKTFGSLR